MCRQQRRVAIPAAFLTALALLGAARVWAAAGPEVIPPEGAVVSAVDVRGQQRTNRQTILNAVSASPGRRITRQQLTDDVVALQKLGFFRDVPPPEVEMTPAGAHITYVVAEYPTIRRVDFIGNTLIPTDQLRAILGVQAGEVFNRDLIERRLRAIEDAYRARGYLASITEEVRLDPSGALVVPIHEARVADVEVQGLQRTREATVLRALNQRPGAFFNETALRADFLRLQNLGVFETIEPQISGAPNGDVVITWRVTETLKTRLLNLGLSYGPQEGLVGTIGFTENNFRRRAERLRVNLDLATVERQVGGELAYSTPVLATGAAYNARVFSLVEYRFSQILAFTQNQAVQRYFERHNGLQLGTGRDLGRGRQVALNGRFEDVKVFNVPASLFEASAPSLNASVLAGGLQFTRDRRDSILYPTRGDWFLAGGDAGFVSRSSGGSGGLMLKPQAEWRFFRPFGRRPAPSPLSTEQGQKTRVLAVRAQAGALAGSVPFFEQYFVGGVDNLRGYQEGRFWGRYSLLVNAEARVPIGGGLVGVAFVDAGHAWGSPYQLANTPGIDTRFRQSRNFAPHLGAGVGVRYLTPLGPLRIDFAYGDRFRTHFTVGQTF